MYLGKKLLVLYVVQALYCRQDNSPPSLQRKGVSFDDRSLERRPAEDEGLRSAALGSRYSPVVPSHLRVFLFEEIVIFFAVEHHYYSAGFGGSLEGRGCREWAAVNRPR